MSAALRLIRRMLSPRITLAAFVLFIPTSQCLTSNDSPFSLTNKATGFCLVKRSTRCVDVRWTTGDRLLVPTTKKCLGVQGKTVNSEVTQYDCDDKSELQKWECRNETLLALKTTQLYIEIKPDQTIALSRTVGPNNQLTITGTSSGACSRTYRELYTLGGNAFGKICMFPFLYKDRWYGDCTQSDSSTRRFWCAVETKFEHEQWGYCPSNSNEHWSKNLVTGAYYQLNTQSVLTWDQAAASCKQQGASLLSVSDPNEQAYLSALLETGKHKLWIGLMLDPEHGWQWSDAKPFRYLRWTSGHPLPNPGHNCAFLDSAGQHTWQSSSCAKKLGYICYKDGAPPTHPQIEQGFCSSPWIPYNGHCFQLQRTLQTWSNAQKECRKEGGDLVSVRNVEDHSFVISQLGYASTDELWIGLNDIRTEGLFDWSDHSPVTFTSWEFGKPSVSTGAEDCVIIAGEKGNWGDRSCDEQHGFICMKQSSTDSTGDEVQMDLGCKIGWKKHGSYCYFVGTETKTFDEAKDDCEASGSYLADVSNGVDNAFLVSLVGLRPEKYFWLGLSNQKNIDEFMWTKGNSVRFTHWNTGMPGYSQGCVAMTTGVLAGLWDLLPCTNRSKYICKHLAEGALPTVPVPTQSPPKCAEGWNRVGTRNYCAKFFTGPRSSEKTWFEARDYCRAIGGDLLSIHSAAELLVARRHGRAWIGLRAPDTSTGYTWSDGSPLNFQGVATVSSEVSGLQEEWGEDADVRPVSDHYLDSNMAEGGYECKYCSFQTAELNLFTMHVDTEHPDVVINTSYVCMECDYHTKSYDTLLAHNARLHPGEENFTRTMVKRNNETIFQQTVNDLTFDGSFVKVEDDEAEDMSRRGIALSKTPIMRIKSRPEPKKFSASHKMALDDIIKVESDDEDVENMEPPTLSPAPMTPAAITPRLIPVSTAVHVQAVPQSIVVNSPNVLQIKGGSGGGVLPPGTLAQVLSALQNQQNNTPTQTQLLIPISSIPTYNTTMDSNVLLVSAYNRFPYPSVSEIMGLSSQTKFSEEQIKVWFSAQRLKHGVSWTPEEVEEARRKKFNGTVQTVPQTITVIPANIAAATNGLQSIFQTCQIVGQPGLVLTQLAGNGSTMPVASPITLTVAGVPGNQPKAAEPSTSESKTEMSAGTALSLDASASKPKKSKEQLAELKASYGRRQFATEAEISRLMQVTKLSKRAIKKWFSDTRYNQRNSKDHHGVLLSETSSSRAATPGGGRGRNSSGSGSLNDSNNSEIASTTIIIDSSDDASDSSPTSANAPGSSGSSSERRMKFRHAFPDFTPQKFKEKTAEQLLFLEASFQKSDTPSDEELSRLRAETKLTRREVDAWFTERRKMPSKDDEVEGDGEKVKPGSVPSSSAQERQNTPPIGRKAVKKTPEQLHILKKAFVRTQWPTSEEYDQMADESGLPRTYIVNWFGDTRYACKNSNLKWYYLYQSGKVDEALNGGAKSHKKSRKRFRGWSRRTRRPYPCKRSPQEGAAAIKVKSGKTFLKDYYLKHRALSEKDLDDLVTKSSMSYEQVRDWFSETAKRVEEGKEPFSEEEVEGEDGEEEDEEEDEEEAGAAENPDSEGEMEVKEQGEEATDDDCNEEEEEEEEAELEEEEVVEDDDTIQEESEGVSQSQPQAEEQT